MPDFPTRFAALGIPQAQFRRWIEQYSDRRMHRSALSRMVSGERPASAEMDALVATLERHPAVLAEIKEMGP